MLRYVALHWNDAEPNASEHAARIATKLDRASPWRQVLSGRGLRVFAHGGHSIEGARAFGPNCLILGKIFERGASERGLPIPVHADDSVGRQIAASHGRYLIDHYWGDYVAVIRDSCDSSIYLLHSPMGSLPCFTAQVRGVTFCFSDLLDLKEFCGPGLVVNWTYIEAHVRYEYIHPEATAIEGVEEVRAGECIRIGATRCERQFYWNPLSFAMADVVDELDIAVELVRHTIQFCVNALAAGNDTIVHSLSGGVDSSIVLACLKRAPTAPNLIALNYHSQGSNTDERAYARAVAKRLEVPLLELPRPSNVRLDVLKDLRVRCPNPSFYIGYAQDSHAHSDLAARYGATAFCTGAGGDQLFYQDRALFAGEDFVRQHGIAPRLLRVAYNAAIIERRSIWSVLRHAVRHGLSRAPYDPQAGFDKEQRFQSKASFARGLYDFGAHPWFKDYQQAARGKRWHAFTMTLLPFYYDPLADDAHPQPAHLLPLLSQPLVELLMRIPTYLLTHDGWDRSIARHAFAGELPSNVIWRRTKGGMEEHARAIMLENMEFIKGMLLDGILASRQLVDKTRLEDYLSLRPSRDSGGMVELFELLSIEAWLQSVQPMARAIAA